MDNKYLLKALNYFSTIDLKDEAYKNAITKAKKYCGTVLWKSQGYYETDISRSMADKIKHTKNIRDTITDVSLKGIEKVDERAIACLWNACEFEIRDTRKDLKAGSEEYFKAVGLRLREIIYRTQVVDSTMTRSQMMRSKDTGSKILTSFSSETTLTFNLVTDMFVTLKLDVRSMGKKAAWEKNKKYIRKGITAFVATGVANAVLNSLFSAFYDYDEDDKDEEYWLKLMLGNLQSELHLYNKIPYINAISSAVAGFSSSRMDTKWLEDSTKAIKELLKLMAGEGSGEKFAKYALKGGSEASGIGIYNLLRDIEAFYELFNGD